MPRKKRERKDGYFDIFPTRLRRVMEKQIATQKELADHLGLTRQAVSAYCDGSSSPDWRTLVKIAGFFSVSSDYLLGLSDNAAVDPEIQAACKYTGLRDYAVEALHSLANDESGGLKLFWLSFLVSDDEFSDFLDDISLSSALSITTETDTAINILRSDRISKSCSMEELFEQIENARRISEDAGGVVLSTKEGAEYYRYKATIKLNKMLERLGGVKEGE